MAILNIFSSGFLPAAAHVKFSCFVYVLFIFAEPNQIFRLMRLSMQTIWSGFPVFRLDENDERFRSLYYGQQAKTNQQVCRLKLKRICVDETQHVFFTI